MRGGGGGGGVEGGVAVGVGFNDIMFTLTKIWSEGKRSEFDLASEAFSI